MRYQIVTVVICLCLSSAFATYGPAYNNGFKPIHGAHHKAKHEESQIHLNSAKIILDRPTIIHGSPAVHHASPLLEEEPIILENEKPLYIRKTLHGIPADVHTDGGHSVVYDTGYSSGKVLDHSAPIQVLNHAPIAHERPVLIRRPVLVSKSLTSTQDHLEKLHYGHAGIGHSGYSLGHVAVPVSKGLHERTLVYGSNLGHGLLGHGLVGHSGGYGLVGHSLGHGLVGHSLGHGLVGHSLEHGLVGHSLGHGLVGHNVGHLSYSAPLILEQPKAYHLGHHSDITLSSGKGLHGTVLHGHGTILHGGSSQHGHGESLKKY